LRLARQADGPVRLQITEYVLWRLRDAPGQKTLTAFQPQPVTRSKLEAHCNQSVLDEPPAARRNNSAGPSASPPAKLFARDPSVHAADWSAAFPTPLKTPSSHGVASHATQDIGLPEAPQSGAQGFNSLSEPSTFSEEASPVVRPSGPASGPTQGSPNGAGLPFTSQSLRNPVAHPMGPPTDCYAGGNGDGPRQQCSALAEDPSGNAALPPHLPRGKGLGRIENHRGAAEDLLFAHSAPEPAQSEEHEERELVRNRGPMVVNYASANLPEQHIRDDAAHIPEKRIPIDGPVLLERQQVSDGTVTGQDQVASVSSVGLKQRVGSNGAFCVPGLLAGGQAAVGSMDRVELQSCVLASCDAPARTREEPPLQKASPQASEPPYPPPEGATPAGPPSKVLPLCFVSKRRKAARFISNLLVTHLP
jgi:hypothetical protein